MPSALFTAKLLINPFMFAKYTFLATERGPARATHSANRN